MSKTLEAFLNESKTKALDAKHADTIRFNINKYDQKVEEGKHQFSNLKLARSRAAAIKNKSIENLDKYLIKFEASFSKRGGKVIWAQDSEEALKEILQIVQKAEAKTVVKGKSMVTEEIKLNDALEKNGIESLETDLGEYIVQLRKEAPYHIVTPAMHLSKEDIALTFSEKKGTKPNLTPEQITSFVRNELREKFTKAEVGIIGANFLIADIGAVASTEN